MFEDRPRKIVYIEGKTKRDSTHLSYQCPECGNVYSWAGRSQGKNKNLFCSGCGNFISWAKVDYESRKAMDPSFKMSFWDYLDKPEYGHTWEKEVEMTYSQSEQNILKGCLMLMDWLVDDFARFLESIGVDPVPECGEEGFSVEVPYSKIVRHLFLWNTSHNGGTSTAMKCQNLGITEDAYTFEFEKGD